MEDSNVWARHGGWDYLWATLMMGFWIVLLGVVVFVAVRLASGDRTKQS